MDVAVAAADLSGSNNITTAAQSIDDVQAVSAIHSSVSAVAASEININAVAANEESINAVTEELPAISSELNADGSNVSNGPAFLPNVGAQPNLGRVPVELTSSATAIVVQFPEGARALRLTGQLMFPNIADVGSHNSAIMAGSTTSLVRRTTNITSSTIGTSTSRSQRPGNPPAWKLLPVGPTMP